MTIGAAVASIGALAITPPVPPPDVHPHAASYDVRLDAASVPLGAIPAAFLRNQLTFCGLICPSIVQLVITVPIGAAESPVAFVGALQSGSLLKAIGAAAESVTAPADAATTGIITPDVFIVVPKAVGKTLEVTAVQAINVGAAILQPGGFIPAVETARGKILEALNEPATFPPSNLPTGAQGFVEVVAVAAINVAVAVAFQAGELLLGGAVHTANVTATELANTGNLGEALRAGAVAATAVVAQAGGIVTDAVNTAVKDVTASLHGPSTSNAQPTTAATTPVQGLTRTTTTPKLVKVPPTKRGSRFVPGVQAGRASSTADTGLIAAVVKSGGEGQHETFRDRINGTGTGAGGAEHGPSSSTPKVSARISSTASN